MKISNLLVLIYSIVLIRQNIIDLLGDQNKIISPLLYSLLQLTTGAQDTVSSGEDLESEFGRLGLVENGVDNEVEASERPAVSFSRIELLSLKDSTREPFEKIEKLHRTLVKHPINKECVAAIFLILQACISELGKSEDICKILRKNYRIVKKQERNYKAITQKYSSYFKSAVSTLFSLNSLINLNSPNVELNSSFVEDIEEFLEEILLFLTRTENFVEFIVQIFTEFCSLKGLTYYTNKVDERIKTVQK
ncbi:hypothetical protein CmeUKMEL1_08090 [Cryptosporidium meleagridis]|uniref:Integral membrane protein n=1 Tax=Cryptosporidium meleagridis TaxID=93969 RepID=A0A2P4Z0I8_9CRYT|nr:hypothetical protein CmeUKMEL1_08090 [Cryptosporidium meleagridis]